MQEPAKRTIPLRVPFYHLLPKRDSDEDSGDIPKTTVIAIAATATVLVVALISGLIIYWVRRRNKKAKNNAGEKAHSNNGDIDFYNQNDRVSKTPLLRQESSSQLSQMSGIEAPRYDDEGELKMPSPYVPQRTLSAGTVRSLPPSYSAATVASQHRPNSSLGGLDGLRPLMLVNAQLSGEEGHMGSRSRSASDAKTEETYLMPIQRPGRPRAHSRFREEDLDV